MNNHDEGLRPAKTVTKLIFSPDDKTYSEDELAEILRRMYNEGEADFRCA